MTLQEKIRSVVQSRKAWASTAALLFAFLGPELSAEIQAGIVAIVTAAYTLGTGIESGLERRKGELIGGVDELIGKSESE